VQLDRASAAKASGVSIDFVVPPGQPKDQGGFKIENPNRPPAVKEISGKDLKKLLDTKEVKHFYDVRTPKERAQAEIGGTLLDDAAMAAIEALPRDTPIAFHCHRGGRSRSAAEHFVKQGFKTVYIKIGFDLDNDIALARAIKDEVGPDVAVRVDANEAWSVFEAVEALQRFEDVGVEFVEQPIDMHDIAGMADLRRGTRVRIGANQSAWLPSQVPQVIAARAGDVIVTDPHQLGGLVPFHNAAVMSQAAGLPICKHAFADLGVTTIATSHVLAALPSPQLGHQQFLTFLVHDLLAEPVEFVDGAIPVPTGPGLGIELDRDALEFYGGIYEQYGEFEGYGPVTPESPLPAELHVRKR